MITHVDLNNAKHAEIFSAMVIDHLNGLDRFPREHVECQTCMFMKDLAVAGTLDAIVRLSYVGRYESQPWWSCETGWPELGNVDMTWVNNKRLQGNFEEKRCLRLNTTR